MAQEYLYSEKMAKHQKQRSTYRLKNQNVEKDF